LRSESLVVVDSLVCVGVSVLVSLVVLPFYQLEVVVELFSSERIVSILLHNFSCLIWLLDVPEEVVWDCSDDLSLQRLGQGLLVSFLEIFNEVVLLPLEYGNLFVVDFLPKFR